MWHGKQRQSHQELPRSLELDMSQHEELYWIFQFCDSSTILKASCVAQAITAWGQVVPAVIVKAPAHALVSFKFPTAAQVKGFRRHLAANRTKQGPHDHTSTEAGNLVPAADCISPGKHQPGASPHQELLLAATGTFAQLQKAVQRAAGLHLGPYATLSDVIHDTDDLALLEAHEASTGMLFGLRGLVGRLRPRSHNSDSPQPQRMKSCIKPAQDKRDAHTQQKAYQTFLEHWHAPTQEPLWKQQQQQGYDVNGRHVLHGPLLSTPAATACEGQLKQANQGGAMTAAAAQDQRIQCTTNPSNNQHHQHTPRHAGKWAHQLQAAEDLLRRAKLQLHQEQNAWPQRRREFGETAALDMQRVLEERVAAAERARQQLVLAKPACRKC